MTQHEIIINVPPPNYEAIQQQSRWMDSKDEFLKTVVEGVFLAAVGWKFWKFINGLDQVKKSSKKGSKNV